MSTRNPYETAQTIFWIVKKEQEEHKHDIVFKIGKKPVEENKYKEMVVAGLPGVGPVISKRLLEHFGSVEKIFMASEEQLRKVDGIGKKLAKNIRTLIAKKY